MERLIWLSGIVLLLGFKHKLCSQTLCEGSLGANLFEDGDFGSGMSNNFPSNAGLAPGYRYVTNGPPSDGEYILTNNMGQWANLYGTWLGLQDNSNDPNGYMMVVNASFEPGLFYEQIITDICENTAFEFSADIINVVGRTVPNHIEPNVAFLIDDQLVLQTGNIPQDERWKTFAFSFTTAPGQNSVKLSLRNNAPGGIGNDLALDNIRFRACGPPSQIVANVTDSIVCTEDSPLQLSVEIESNVELENPFYQWQAESESGWSNIDNSNAQTINILDVPTGSYRYRVSFAGTEFNFDNEKCRFFSEPIKLFIPQREFFLTDTICGGTGIDISGLTITEPGIYVEELVSSLGCDSITTYFIDTIARATISAELDLEDPLCYQTPTGVIAGLNIANGYAPYFISVDGKDYTSTIADNLIAGPKQVQIIDRYGCFFESEVSLSDPEEFIISIGPDQEVLLGEEVSVDIISNQVVISASIINPPPGLIDSSNLVIVPFDNSELIVQAYSEDACITTDSINISVDQDVSLYIPNAFSPNGDGMNDLFKVSAVGRSIQNIEFLNIYSKWGELVYSSSELSGWDGYQTNGEKSINSVYIYHLKGSLINDAPIEEVGSLQLFR